jgi:Holliday junction DNA helicase RuvA
MIARLQGIVVSCKPTEVILDVSGVGYLVEIPLTVFDYLETGKEAVLHIHTYVREEQLRLFGFTGPRERELFSLLLGVSGIGPSMALSILSGLSTNDLVHAVRNEDISRLVRVPGIGKSKAEKLIFELKRKSGKLDSFVPDEGTGEERDMFEAVEALVSLGFDESGSRQTVKSIVNEEKSISLEGLIKEALKRLSS